MRAAIAAAEVGDDVFGEDPTVRRLEEQSADLLGKEAALFVPRGTMGNQTRRADPLRRRRRVPLRSECHIFNYEQAAYGPVLRRARAAASRPRRHSSPSATSRTRSGPTTFTTSARGWSASKTPTTAAAGGCYRRRGREDLRAGPPRTAWPATSTAPGCSTPSSPAGSRRTSGPAASTRSSVCFSKGLGAPVGSALVGPRDLIKQARRLRKALGGGLRQAGILAAAASYALDHHVERLAEDHANAQILADAIRQSDALKLVPSRSRRTS